ncbi:hypothetical protein [Pleomorphomonas sp. PLEO]|uniref:hypothetical protein n=1 Tax=Pleomorphomonas sp. PLEO TaxID=3239306 RepID=UPI00351E9478
MKLLRVLAVSLAAVGPVKAEQAARPSNFLFASSQSVEELTGLLARPDIEGVQVVYNWKALEPSRGVYDFSQIQHDLAIVDGVNKKLFIQIQDRFFSPKARNIPDYLIAPDYGGGLVAQVDNAGEGQPVGAGWVATQWNPRLRDRYQGLLRALAEQFDGKVYGVNLPETAIDIDMKGDRTGFSCDAYFNAELENLAVARQAFKTSHVVQYVNFWPCEWNNDHRYMERLFQYAEKNGVGLGGPDVIPYRKGQMKNAYPFFHQYAGKLPLIAMAIQEPTLTYKNAKTGKPFTRDEFEQFATDYLGANIIFWSPATPWLGKAP